MGMLRARRRGWEAVGCLCIGSLNADHVLGCGLGQTGHPGGRSDRRMEGRGIELLYL